MLVRFNYHKVEWIILVNYRQVTEPEETLEAIGIQEGDHLRIKGVFTKYGIRMRDGKPEPEVEIEIEETAEAEEAAEEEDFGA